MIRIYDMNSYARMSLETDISGLFPRNFTQDVFACPDTVICVWDGPNSSGPRKKLFHNYKAGRVTADRSIFDGFRMVQDLLKHTKAVQIKLPDYEADDVIATLTKRWSGADKIAIYSRDFDLMQLAGPNVVVGAAPKDFIKNPAHIRLYKTTVGDPSDKIYGIAGFGQKSWEANDPEKLGAAVAKWIETDTVDDADFADLVMPKRCVDWLKLNPHQLRVFWEIVGFYDVPIDLINEHMVAGVPDRAAADALLQEFMQ